MNGERWGKDNSNRFNNWQLEWGTN